MLDISECVRGTRVEKIKGYRWPGVIISAFTTLGGELRVVVECTAPDVAGALHIYSREQLRRADEVGD